MGELELFRYLIIGWVVVAAATFVLLTFVSAPYGRHGRKGWGPTIHRTAGWILMELPALATPVVCYALGDRHGSVGSLVLLGMWLLHYVNRTLVFPWRMRGGALRMPLVIMGMGVVFNLVNGCMQGRWLFTLGPERGVEWLLDPRFILGALVFLFGFGLNYHSDGILRRLRAPGETGYKIPRGGGFRFVTSPNYLGEILEWTGWAVATWSLAGAVFALWTFANLAPRARTHHAWYRATFPDYPPDRKALVPYLF